MLAWRADGSPREIDTSVSEQEYRIWVRARSSEKWRDGGGGGGEVDVDVDENEAHIKGGWGIALVWMPGCSRK